MLNYCSRDKVTFVCPVDSFKSQGSAGFFCTIKVSF